MSWLYVPGLLSAPAPADSNSELHSQFQGTAPSLGLNGKPALPRSLSAAWKKGGWIRLLSGLTCEPSMAQAGVERWTSSLRASRASHSASPANSEGSKTRATSGLTSSASSGKSGPPLSSSKTYPAFSQLELPMGDTPTNSLKRDFKGWVTTLRQDSLRRQKSARRTRGNVCSSWPTPDANAINDGESPESFMARRARLKETTKNGNGAGIPLTVASVMWPTANAHDGRRPGSAATSTQGANLKRGAETWASPKYRDWKGGQGAKPRHSPDLDKMAEMWKTPCANEDAAGRPGANMQQQLKQQVEVFSHLVPESTGDGSASSPTSPRRLNPRFVEWLMGWPVGWTSVARSASGSLATEWSRWLPLMRSELSRLNSVSEEVAA